MKCMLSTLMGKMRYTIQDVHDQTGLGRSTITELYYDRASRIDYATIEKLCSLFECSIGELFALDAETENTSGKSKKILSKDLKKALSEHNVRLTDEELDSVAGGAVIIVKPESLL